MKASLSIHDCKSLIMLFKVVFYIKRFTLIFLKISPNGILNVPISYPVSPLKILSETLQDIAGVNRSLIGNGTSKLIIVLIVGLGPKGPGVVNLFLRSCAKSPGGTKELRPNSINAFLTGKKPGD